MSRIGLLLAAMLAVAALAPATAHAKWTKAETDRFIVYGQGGEGQVRSYVTKLATFDAVLRAHYPATKDRRAGTKLQVVLLNGDLKRIAPSMSSSVAGYYTPRPDGLFAFVETSYGSQGDFVLFHEYAHHFMLENFPVAYPAWFVEGFAEYFMTAEITPRGVKIGGINEGRAYQIVNQPWMPWEELFAKTTGETKREKVYAYYAQAWLLAHYMRSDSARAKMLDAAVTAISGGAAPAEAFWKATGWDAKKLNKELRAYQRLSGYIMENPLKSPPQITYAPLSNSADDMFLDRMRIILSSGPDPAFLEQVRKRAARHPGDALAELTLARAEYAMGDVTAADAMIQRRLAAVPKDYETLVEAGLGRLISGRRDKDKRSEHLRAARSYFNRAFAQNDSDYRVLYGYALSRTVEPGFPSENDMNALLVARELAPSFTELSMQAGMALLVRGRRDEAVVMLAPVANDPHSRGAAAFAKSLIEGKTKADAEAAAKAMDGVDEPPGPPPA
jgi:hypothetical protein